MIKKWDTWGVEERCEAEKGGGGVKEGGKKNRRSKKVVEKYFAMV